MFKISKVIFDDIVDESDIAEPAITEEAVIIQVS